MKTKNLFGFRFADGGNVNELAPGEDPKPVKESFNSFYLNLNPPLPRS